MKTDLLSCVMIGALVLLPPPLAAQSEVQPRYTIKETDAPTGSGIRRDRVTGTGVALNLPYEKLPDTDRKVLHSYWESIPEGDEPPFPLEGLGAVLTPIATAQQRILEVGPLFMVGTVAPDGRVTSVAVMSSPSQQMAKFAAQILLLTKFKPGRCAGLPCQMDFPVRIQFSTRP